MIESAKMKCKSQPDKLTIHSLLYPVKTFLREEHLRTPIGKLYDHMRVTKVVEDGILHCKLGGDRVV